MGEELQEVFRASLNKHLDDMRRLREEHGGDTPAHLIAESDQFVAECNELLDILVSGVRGHRKDNRECCTKDAKCIGMEVPLIIASISEMIEAHMMGALTMAAGRLAELPEVPP